jgi:hypothetical protein
MSDTCLIQRAPSSQLGGLNGGDDCTNLNSRLDTVVNGPAFIWRWGEGLQIFCFAAREAASDAERSCNRHGLGSELRTEGGSVE